ncbi:hypothetical protein F5H01DRAFT_368789 [Linnemannia elongata]|nr:hypothetical protein F5H01DRAFT_368789 [Linnemannia elongata]
MDRNQQRQRHHPPNQQQQQQQQQQQRGQGQERQRQEQHDSHAARHTITPSVPRRTLTRLSTTTHSTKTSSDDFSGDEIQPGHHTSAYQNVPHTGQRCNLAMYRPTVVNRQKTFNSDTNSDSSASAFEEDPIPRHTEVPVLQSRRSSSFPTPQRLQPRPQSTILQSKSRAEARTAPPDTHSRRPANAIHSTFSRPAPTTHNRTESQPDMPKQLSWKQRSNVETNSESDDVELVSTVRTARRESITSSFARMETRQSNSPKQEPLPAAQLATQSKTQQERDSVHESDLPQTALENRIGSLRTSFTEKQRLALQAIILGSQTKDAHPATFDTRPSISKTATTANRGKQDDGENKSDPLLVDSHVNVADSPTSASTDSYSGCDSTAGTAIMCEPPLETPVDLHRKRVFSAGVKPNNDLSNFPRPHEEPTMPSRRYVGVSDLNKALNHRDVIKKPKRAFETMTRFPTPKEKGANPVHDRTHSHDPRQLDQCRANNDNGRIQGDKSSGVKRGVLNGTRARRLQSDANESSQSDIAYPASTLSWAYRRGHSQRRGMKGKHRQGSGSDISSDSEYRGPEERVITMATSPAPRDTAGVSPSIQRISRRKSIWTKPIMWVLRMFLWLVFLVVVQIVVMGLLFRPIASKILDKGQVQKPGTITYKGRDYVADRPGYMTFLEDGFGTETLAFCQDLLEFSNDHRGQVRVAQPLWDQILDRLALAYDVSMDAVSRTYSVIERLLTSSWAYLEKRRKGESEEVDNLEWLAKS